MGRLDGLVAVLAIAGATACAGPSALPDRDDFGPILAEASGESAVSNRTDNPARRAVRRSLRTVLYLDSVHQAEIARRWRRPELTTSYLLRDESFVGGDFPGKIAGLLRECQDINRDYLAGMEGYSEILRDHLTSAGISEPQAEAIASEFTDTLMASRQTMIEYFESVDAFFDALAQIYELAEKYPSAFVAARDGLEVNDDYALERFNTLVEEVDRSTRAANDVLQRLSEADKMRVVGMGLAIARRRTGP